MYLSWNVNLYLLILFVRAHVGFNQVSPGCWPPKSAWTDLGQKEGVRRILECCAESKGCRRKPERTLSASLIFVFLWHLSPSSLSGLPCICKNAGRWPPDGGWVYLSAPSQLRYLHPNLRSPGETAWLVQLRSSSVPAPINHTWSNRRWRRVTQHE